MALAGILFAGLVAIAIFAFIMWRLSRVLPTIATPDGRRAWAFIAIWLGCIVFTLYAAVAMYIVRGNQWYSLILGLAAHAQLFIGLGAFSWTLGRRMNFSAGKDGIALDDREAVAAAARETAAVATNKAEQIAADVGATDAGMADPDRH